MVVPSMQALQDVFLNLNIAGMDTGRKLQNSQKGMIQCRNEVVVERIYSSEVEISQHLSCTSNITEEQSDFKICYVCCTARWGPCPVPGRRLLTARAEASCSLRHSTSLSSSRMRS